MARVKKKISDATTRIADPAASGTGIGAKAGKQGITPEQRYLMIQEAAYYRAEKAGFLGESAEHWLAAEKEIDAKLAQK